MMPCLLVETRRYETNGSLLGEASMSFSLAAPALFLTTVILSKLLFLGAIFDMSWLPWTSHKPIE
jgi:hypothetical protein